METLNRTFVYGLYSHTEPDLVRYVGITTKSLAERMANHRYDLFVKNIKTKKTKWMKEVLDNNSDIEIKAIEECVSFKIACERERYWISLFRQQGVDLVNSTSGGQGLLALEIPEQTKKKISDTLKGHSVSKSTRDKISQSVKEYWQNMTKEKKEDFCIKKKNISIETREKMSQSKIGKKPWQGKKHSENSKIKMRESALRRYGNNI